MAEKLDLAVKVTTDASSLDVLTGKLDKAREAAKEMAALFGEGSKEAQKAAAEVGRLETQITKTKTSSAGLDEPIKSMKAQLKEANNELLQTNEQYQKNIAKIKDAKTLTDAFNPDAKFKGLGNAIQGATGALTAITGAQALFGTESKAVHETLLKVQGAMAFSQGINSVLESKDAFKALYAQIAAVFTAKKIDVAATEAQIVAQEGLVVAQNASAAASKLLKSALIATGIGALLVAVGTLLAYWDDIKAAVSGVSKEQEKQTKDAKAKVESDEKSLKLIEGSTEQYKLQGKTEKEILAIKLKEVEKAILNQAIQIQTAENTKKTQVEAAKRNAEFTKGIIMMLTSPIQVILGVLDAVSFGLNKIGAISDETYTKFGNLREGFTNSLTSMIFDPAETEMEGQKVIDEQKTKLEELKEKQAGFKNQVNDINKKADQDAKQLRDAADKKAEEDRKKKEQDELEAAKKSQELAKENAEKREKNAKDTRDRLTQIELDGIKDTNQKRRRQLEIEEQDNLDIEKQKFQKGQTNLTEYLAAQALIRAQFAQQRKDFEAKITADATKKELDDRIKALDEEIKAGGINFEAQRAALQKKNDINKELLAQNLIDKEEYNKRYKELSDQEDAIDMAQLDFKQKKAQEIFKLFQGAAELFKSILDAASEKINRQQTKDAKVQKELLDSKKITNEQYQKNIAKINEDAEKKQNKIQRKQILTDKAMAIAGIVMNTLQANAKAAVLYPPTGLPFTVYNTIAGALSVATTIAAAVKALSALGGGGGGDSSGGADASALGASSGGGGAAPIAPVASTTALPQDQINQLSTANAATRAYVIESDVTNSQDRITRINRAARIN